MLFKIWFVFYSRLRTRLFIYLICLCYEIALLPTPLGFFKFTFGIISREIAQLVSWLWVNVFKIVKVKTLYSRLRTRLFVYLICLYHKVALLPTPLGFFKFTFGIISREVAWLTSWLWVNVFKIVKVKTLGLTVDKKINQKTGFVLKLLY